MARPTKRNTERETTLLNALREGQTRSCACGLAGIDADTFPRWCKASPDFASAVAKAESEAEQSRVLTIQQASIGGVGKRRLGGLHVGVVPNGELRNGYVSVT